MERHPPRRARRPRESHLRPTAGAGAGDAGAVERRRYAAVVDVPLAGMGGTRELADVDHRRPAVSCAAAPPGAAGRIRNPGAFGLRVDGRVFGDAARAEARLQARPGGRDPRGPAELSAEP